MFSILIAQTEASAMWGTGALSAVCSFAGMFLAFRLQKRNEKTRDNDREVERLKRDVRIDETLKRLDEELESIKKNHVASQVVMPTLARLEANISKLFEKFDNLISNPQHRCTEGERIARIEADLSTLKRRQEHLDSRTAGMSGTGRRIIDEDNIHQ